MSVAVGKDSCTFIFRYCIRTQTSHYTGAVITLTCTLRLQRRSLSLISVTKVTAVVDSVLLEANEFFMGSEFEESVVSLNHNDVVLRLKLQLLTMFLRLIMLTNYRNKLVLNIW